MTNQHESTSTVSWADVFPAALVLALWIFSGGKETDATPAEVPEAVPTGYITQGDLRRFEHRLNNLLVSKRELLGEGDAIASDIRGTSKSTQQAIRDVFMPARVEVEADLGNDQSGDQSDWYEENYQHYEDEDNPATREALGNLAERIKENFAGPREAAEVRGKVLLAVEDLSKQVIATVRDNVKSPPRDEIKNELRLEGNPGF